MAAAKTKTSKLPPKIREAYSTLGQSKDTLTLTMMQHLETFLEIVNEPPPFDGSSEKEDREACERLLAEFTDDEVEQLAMVSYAYWIVYLKANDRLPAGSRQNSALKEIRRHYVGEHRHYDRTLAAIREAMEYHWKYRPDIIRCCCHDDFEHNDEDAKLAKKYRSYVLRDLKRQTMVVRGVDAHGRIIVYKPPRNAAEEPSEDDDEAFTVAQIYTAERAMATNEFCSRGKQERVTVVFNARDYNRRNTPAISTLMMLTKVSQRCYPERLGALVIVDAPFWMRAVANILWPLLSKAVSEKIRIPTSELLVKQEFSELINEGDKDLERLLSTGDITSVDIQDYVHQPLYAPFHQK